jgi:phosphoglycolate phosphatase
MKVSYEAILFDLDGTLLDTLNDLSNAVNRVLAQHGFPIHQQEAYRYFVGDGAKMLMTRALPEHQRHENTIQTCLEEFQEEYGQHWNVETSVYQGIAEMLDRLYARGIHLAILSNKPHEFTRRCVEEFLSKWTFDVVLGQHHSIPQKPDPAGALLIAQRIGVSTSSFLYLGDTAIDMKTARAAGMFPVGVLWGFRPIEELQEHGAKAFLNHPLEVLTLLS